MRSKDERAATRRPGSVFAGAEEEIQFAGEDALEPGIRQGLGLEDGGFDGALALVVVGARREDFDIDDFAAGDLADADRAALARRNVFRTVPVALDRIGDCRVVLR